MTLIGTKEVAKLLGKHRNTVRQWIQSGQLPAPTIRERYWVKSDIVEWVSQRRHLSPSQLAMVAAKAREIYEREAKERQAASLKQNQQTDSVVENFPPRTEHGKARDLAGKAVDHATTQEDQQ